MGVGSQKSGVMPEQVQILLDRYFMLGIDRGETPALQAPMLRVLITAWNAEQILPEENFVVLKNRGLLAPWSLSFDKTYFRQNYLYLLACVLVKPMNYKICLCLTHLEAFVCKLVERISKLT